MNVVFFPAGHRPELPPRRPGDDRAPPRGPGEAVRGRRLRGGPTGGREPHRARPGEGGRGGGGGQVPLRGAQEEEQRQRLQGVVGAGGEYIGWGIRRTTNARVVVKIYRVFQRNLLLMCWVHSLHWKVDFKNSTEVVISYFSIELD